MERGQSVYVVTCPECSSPVQVVNPKIGVEPVEVYATGIFGLLNDNVVHTRCPNCGSKVMAQFEYR